MELHSAAVAAAAVGSYREAAFTLKALIIAQGFFLHAPFFLLGAKSVRGEK